MAAHLCRMPVEIIFLIFESASSPDLLHLILASRRYHQIFSAAPKRLIAASLKNSVPEQLWADFCAARHVQINFGPVLDRNLLAADRAKVQAFIRQYFNPSLKFELSTSPGEFLVAHKLHHRVSHFISDFTRKAYKEALDIADNATDITCRSMHANFVGDKDQDNTSISEGISASEKLRLYRAFLRFEIYATLFRPAQSWDELTRYSGQAQFRWFLRNLTASEVEEITCIHQYFSDIITAILSEMHQEFEAEIISLDIKASQNMIKGSKWRGLSCLFDSGLYLFSQDFQDKSSQAIGSMTSSGLPYLFKFLQSDKDTRYKLLRRNSFRKPAFLLEALSASPLPASMLKVLSDDEELQESILEALSAETPRGSLLKVMCAGFAEDRYNHGFSEAAEHGYLSADGGMQTTACRRLGYVFWDSNRLQTSPIQEALLRAKSTECQCQLATATKLSARRSPGENLQNVRLPEEYFDTLIDDLVRYTWPSMTQDPADPDIWRRLIVLENFGDPCPQPEMVSSPTHADEYWDYRSTDLNYRLSLHMKLHEVRESEKIGPLFRIVSHSAESRRWIRHPRDAEDVHRPAQPSRDPNDRIYIFCFFYYATASPSLARYRRSA